MTENDWKWWKILNLASPQRGADGLVLQDHSFEASLGFPVNGGCRNNGVDCLLANTDTRCGYDDDDGLYQVFVKVQEEISTS